MRSASPGDILIFTLLKASLSGPYPRLERLFSVTNDCPTSNYEKMCRSQPKGGEAADVDYLVGPVVFFSVPQHAFRVAANFRNIHSLSNPKPNSEYWILIECVPSKVQ